MSLDYLKASAKLISALSQERSNFPEHFQVLKRTGEGDKQYMKCI